METIEGYKLRYEKKKKILYSRMDDSMIVRLKEISRKTGISVSEILREGARRLLHDVDESGSFNIKLQ
jgi:predicted DNA-binding protein